MSEGTSESKTLLSNFDILSSRVIPSNHLRDARSADQRYAANAITLPPMDMYSNLLPTDAAAMLDHLTPTILPSTESGKAFNKHWRGRYGLTESEQEELWATKNPDTIPEAIAKGEAITKAKGKAEQEAREEKKVVELKFKTYEGELRTVNANVGDTLLQVARANDLPSMEGSCGGNLGMSLFTLFPSSLSPVSRLHLPKPYSPLGHLYLPLSTSASLPLSLSP
jgi:hypothetical protein